MSFLPAIDRKTLQLIVVGLVVLLWSISALVAIWDGKDLLRITTPMATLSFGWLYGDKAVSKS